MTFLKDIARFIIERKIFWLAPMIIILIFIGILMVFGGSSTIAPFIYTLF